MWKRGERQTNLIAGKSVRGEETADIADVKLENWDFSLLVDQKKDQIWREKWRGGGNFSGQTMHSWAVKEDSRCWKRSNLQQSNPGRLWIRPADPWDAACPRRPQLWLRIWLSQRWTGCGRVLRRDAPRFVPMRILRTRPTRASSSATQSINQSISQSINQSSVNQSINQSVNQSTNQSINRSINR